MPPLFVVLTGKPASGKTTLASALADPGALGIPLLSRDAIKAGLEETANTPSANTDAAILDATQSVFFDTIEMLLRNGVSLITDVGFSDWTNLGLRRVSALATTVVIHCQVGSVLAQRRFIERTRISPRISEKRRARIESEMTSGAFDWSRWDDVPIDAPVIRVDTGDGSQLDVGAIVAFVRGVR